jgi:hypothetical protein
VTAAGAARRTVLRSRRECHQDEERKHSLHGRHPSIRSAFSKPAASDDLNIS